jgi:SNF2 family DNA or RNA helicase
LEWLIIKINDALEPIIQDYVILDEGHTIKNPQTKISKAMQVLNSNKRLILSGTPIQNNLMEMWCLVDWVTKGNIIGNKPSIFDCLINHEIRNITQNTTDPLPMVKNYNEKMLQLTDNIIDKIVKNTKNGVLTPEGEKLKVDAFAELKKYVKEYQKTSGKEIANIATTKICNENGGFITNNGKDISHRKVLARSNT